MAYFMLIEKKEPKWMEEKASFSLKVLWRFGNVYSCLACRFMEIISGDNF